VLPSQLELHFKTLCVVDSENCPVKYLMNRVWLSVFQNSLMRQSNKFRTRFSSFTTHTVLQFFLSIFCHHSEHPLEFLPPHLPNSLPSLLYWCVHYVFHTSPFFSTEASSRPAFSGFSFLWYIRYWTTCQFICLTFRTLSHSAVILLCSADLATLLCCSSTLMSVCTEGHFVIHQTTLFGDFIRTH
jgi:hypothetical protein